MTGPNSWLPLPLVGRQQELTVIRRALGAAAKGDAGAVVIAGGQGVGKTRLLEAVLAEATERGFIIAHGTASQSDADVPYSIFGEAFTPVVRSFDSPTINSLVGGAGADLARVVPAFDASPSDARRAADGPDDLTMRVRWHFMQWVERLAARKPLVLVIDNAHWADPSSVGLVQFILRHAPRARLLVLVAHNPAELDVDAPFREMLKALAGRQHVQQLRLGPVGQSDVLDILESAFRVPRVAVIDFGTELFATTSRTMTGWRTSLPACQPGVLRRVA